MLGYSSIEHMGLAMLMTSAGVPSLAFCHLFCHGLFKSGLFMTAENISISCGTRRIDDIRGVFSNSPLRAVLWLGGIILICGMPPGALFFTEYKLISKLGDWQAILLIVLLFLIFAGMLHAALRMVSGKAPERMKVSSLMDVPALVLVLASVMAGVLVAAVLYLG
jgi:hydrogenase-4 component F